MPYVGNPMHAIGILRYLFECDSRRVVHLGKTSRRLYFEVVFLLSIFNFNNMENQPTKLDRAVKISIIIGALLLASSIAYYLVIFLPQKERTMLEQWSQQQVKNKSLLANCLDNASKVHENNWNDACASRGAGERCGLPTNVSSRIDKSHEGDKDDCFRKYPQ